MKSPIKICLLMQGGRNWIGGSEYIKNIILALGSLPEEVCSTFQVSLLCNTSLDPEIRSQVEPYVAQFYTYEFDLQPNTALNRIRWKSKKLFSKELNGRLSEFFREKGFDFVYPYVEPSLPQSKFRTAAWIYDFQHKYLPHLFTEEEIHGRNQTFSYTAQNASTVVLSSKNAELDFHKFFPNSIAKTEVLQFKTSPNSKWYQGNPYQVQKNYFLPDRYFMVSNQFWQHKNHLVVFKALNILKEKSVYPNVVCTGHIHDYRCSDYSDIILQTIHKLGIANQVYLLGLIPKFDQVQLMRRSLAVIQPSLFEGWSTLVEDARCFGKSLILSNIPVHLEQKPPNSIFFEGESPEQLANLIADWWEHLSLGPHLDQENKARVNSYGEVQTFAYRFLEIVQRCLHSSTSVLG